MLFSLFLVTFPNKLLYFVYIRYLVVLQWLRPWATLLLNLIVLNLIVLVYCLESGLQKTSTLAGKFITVLKFFCEICAQRAHHERISRSLHGQVYKLHFITEVHLHVHDDNSTVTTWL